MPYDSAKQVRFIHAQANKGVAWAKRVVAKGHAKRKRGRAKRR